MIETDAQYSPGWWLKTLAAELHNRRCGRSDFGGRRRQWSRAGVDSSRVRPGLDLLNDYFRGDPPLRKDIHEGWAEPFRQFVRMGRLNFADLLVSSTGNRMGIRDFRTAAAQDELGDQVARDIMRANNLKLVSRDVHDYMLALGDGYLMVTPPDAQRRMPLMTAESPLSTITANDAATGKVLAGLKMFRDDWDARDWAYLFLPGEGSGLGEMYVASMDGRTTLGRDGWFRFSPGSWSWDFDLFDDVPGGHVPIVRFRNRRGVGEFEQHLDHLDRINDKVFNEWWIGKINGFRQRAVKNLPDRDSVTNELIDYSDMFTSSPDALWQLPENSEIWESSVVDVGPLVNSIQKELQWLAAATSKPLQTLAPDAANQSATGASLMREEHVYAIEDRRDRSEGGWARGMSLALEFMGDMQRADATKIEPIWGPVERYTLDEKATASQKAKGTLPDEAIFTDIWQYAPAQIPDLRALQGRDLLFRQPSAAAAPVSPGGPTPAPEQ